MKARKSSEELRQRLGIESVTEVVRRGRLRWFGHVERKEGDDWVRACQRVAVEGKRSRGRGRKTWRECCGRLESTWAKRRGGTEPPEMEMRY